ncbi:ThuA domain-containing protein [Candidatus Latescibacterota bacterium]
MGDYWHLASAQERHVRQIFAPNRDWKVYFVLASSYLTKELLSDTDLLITARYGGGDDPAWSPEPIVGQRPPGDQIWTEEHISAVIDNVRNRGMGWLAVHCNVFCGSTELEDLMGIEPLLHQEMQPLIVQDLNQEHPITKGITPFTVTLDDQFDIELKYPQRTSRLFNTLAVHDKRVSLNGWCLEQGKGRVVGLIPGQFQFVYRVPQYQEIFWRSAYWAMNREIEPYPNASSDTKGFV